MCRRVCKRIGIRPIPSSDRSGLVAGRARRGPFRSTKLYCGWCDGSYRQVVAVFEERHQGLVALYDSHGDYQARELELTQRPLSPAR
jgi:hypothetical protein